MNGAGKQKLLSPKPVPEILLWGCVALFSLLYFSLIFNDNVWTDEVFTMRLIRDHTFAEITHGTAIDVHPPLYYYYAKIFMMLFGPSVPVQKIAAILPVSGMMIYIATVVKNRFGPTAAFLSVLFYVCLPCTMEFAVMLRMYSLSVFAVTLCAVSAWLVYTEEKTRHWVWYSAGVLGAAYLHYFAFVAVIWTGVLLFLAIVAGKRRLVKRFFLATAVQIAGYLPWIPFMWQQVTSRYIGEYWIPPITPATLRADFKWTFGLERIPNVPYVFLILIGGLFVFCVVKLLEKGKTAEEKKAYRAALLAFMIPACTAMTGYVLSLMPDRNPVYRAFYLFPSLGCMALFAGLAAEKIRRALLVAVCVFLAFTGVVQYRECHRQEYDTLLEETRAFFAENATPNDVILVNYEPFVYVLGYYFDDVTDYPVDFMDNYDFSTGEHRVFILQHYYAHIPYGELIDTHYVVRERGHYGVETIEFTVHEMIPRPDAAW